MKLTETEKHELKQAVCVPCWSDFKFSKHIYYHIWLTKLLGFKERIARQFLTWNLEEEVEGGEENDIRAKLRKLLCD